MLLGTKKEGAIDQRIAIKDEQRLLTQNALNATHLRLGERGEDEEACLIVAMIALVLNLQNNNKKIWRKLDTTREHMWLQSV